MKYLPILAISLLLPLTSFAAKPVLCTFYYPSLGVDFPEEDFGNSWFSISLPETQEEKLTWQLFQDKKERTTEASRSFIEEVDPLKLMSKWMPFVTMKLSGFEDLDSGSESDSESNTKKKETKKPAAAAPATFEIASAFISTVSELTSMLDQREADEEEKVAPKMEFMYTQMKAENVGSIRAFKSTKESGMGAKLIVFFDKQGNILEKWTGMSAGDFSGGMYKCSDQLPPQ